MNLKIFALMLCVMPGVAYSASRSGAVDGGGRTSRASARVTSGAVASSHAANGATSTAARGDDSTNTVGVPGASCRDAYRACMDEFCLQDEADGYRCICSDNYNAAKKLLAQINDIQAQADDLLNTKTQEVRLGAKAKLVMNKDDGVKKTSAYDDEDDDDISLDDDDAIGADLYEMASAACAAQLKACGDRSEMEEQLYSRMVVNDCKSFNSYLNEQKTYAEQNKNAAKLAVVNARLEVLDTTNKYNRGECLLAYKACVADKGGCGVHFENCLDRGLLNRRANACENVLDQCMAVADDVKEDWKAEINTIIQEGNKYTDNNKRTTCIAKTQLCLEENCSPQTNVACLTSVDVAAGVCPIIKECDDIITGFKQAVVEEQLKDLQVTFCENDVTTCLKEKCGADFTGPQCLGQSTSVVTDLCPRSRFRTCSNVAENTYGSIVSGIRLQYNYKQLEACQNHFSERLSAVCGTDMACLPDSEIVQSLAAIAKGEGYDDAEEDAENSSTDFIKLIENNAYKQKRKLVIAEADAAVDDFFTQFEQDITVDACKSAEKPSGDTVGNTIYNTAKIVAKNSAEQRALRQLETKIAELSRQHSIEQAEQTCKSMYAVETPSKEQLESKESFSYIRSVAFEPSLRNCHVCRMQRVCETGGEKEETSALKAAGGGLTAGMAMGAQVHSVWGTIIGGAIGAAGAGFLGSKSGGQETYCQDVESCEDINL